MSMDLASALCKMDIISSGFYHVIHAAVAYLGRVNNGNY